ncbi:hypothetical protein F5Y18DRAFT_442971 [Xylariaceae sp. FL1019]|nr:hypothetical protein F5Y18DRAFT_442971 [Xylariaceae sp. FL1019]
MPRFPVNFRRKSTATEEPNAPPDVPSFRVLERPNSSNVKGFDGGAKYSRPLTHPHKRGPDLDVEDNLFAGLTSNRGSGSSNTTKTNSDNSSRHSNVSTAPSSAENVPPQEEWRNPSYRKPATQHDDSTVTIPPLPPVPKASGFLNKAGRTFSFGSNKKGSLPSIPADEPVPPLPEYSGPGTPSARSRATTESTISTATPPRVEDRDFMLDLGGDLSTVFSKFDKRSSVVTLKGREGTNARPNQPSPLHLDRSTAVEPPPRSWNSQHSDEGLLGTGRMVASPDNVRGLAGPPSTTVASRPSRSSADRRLTEEDDEDSALLSDSLAATRFLSNSATTRAYQRDPPKTKKTGLAESYANSNEDNLFDKSTSRPPKIIGSRMGGRSLTAPQNKVMTPEEFEKYRRDKANDEKLGIANSDDSDKDEDVNYDDDDEDEDELEKSKQAEKQRRRQEAQMSVYRQTMMKVTGESANPARPGIAMSMSTPNLSLGNPVIGKAPSPFSDGSEEDEEVPLGILAAHGFPGKNRPPTRLTNMPSQPDLRASLQPPSTGGPGSVAGGGAGVTSGGRLPPFARKLPQDPYLGAGLINQPPRESMAFGGGSSAQGQPRVVPTGGLVGVIANEERARALRRGSPAIDNARNTMPHAQINPAFDPINGIPPQMMYPMGMQQAQPQMLNPTDQAQLQMNQQMTQFLQMQMQFMQMMASQNNGSPQTAPRPMGHMPTYSNGSFADMSGNSFQTHTDMQRNSFMSGAMSNGMGPSVGHGMGPSSSLEIPQVGSQGRTMSMIQPSSASWIQPPPSNYASQLHTPGGGYAPSIAPSERSNIGLPGRYRPVSSVPQPEQSSGRTSTMGTSIPVMHSKLNLESKRAPVRKDDDDDDEEGWEAMKAKREQKKSLWKSKKNFGSDILESISFNS